MIIAFEPLLGKSSSAGQPDLGIACERVRGRVRTGRERANFGAELVQNG
jgi:hypothetical protein